MNYKQYLSGSDWINKRVTKLERKNGEKRRCAICSSKTNLDVHHLNYRNLYDVEQSDLRVLCRRCHFLAHNLHKRGAFRFTSENQHSRFERIKAAVKRELGLVNKNMFLDGDISRKHKKELPFDQYINGEWVHKKNSTCLSDKGKIRACVCGVTNLLLFNTPTR